MGFGEHVLYYKWFLIDTYNVNSPIVLITVLNIPENFAGQSCIF